MSSRWLVAYDVADDRARARVAAILARHGVRRQLSVFSCEFDDTELENVVVAVRSMVDVRRDVVQWFRQCADCHERTVGIGQVVTGLDELWWVV